MFFGSLIWADSNGVWHRAEDVRSGTFGADEGSGDYIFNNDLIINNNLKVSKIEPLTPGGNVEIII